MTKTKSLLVIFAILAMPLALLADHATVRVEPSNLHGSRPLQEQTATAVIRDYLQSWQAMRAALEQNRVGLLDPDFVGTARDKLADTIHEQAGSGIHTRYLDRAHDLRIIFYSPDGLSVQLIDNAEFDQQVLTKDGILATHRVRARYIVVLTPAETRWRVRLFQSVLK